MHDRNLWVSENVVPSRSQAPISWEFGFDPRNRIRRRKCAWFTKMMFQYPDLERQWTYWLSPIHFFVRRRGYCIPPATRHTSGGDVCGELALYRVHVHPQSYESIALPREMFHGGNRFCFVRTEKLQDLDRPLLQRFHAEYWIFLCANLENSWNTSWFKRAFLDRIRKRCFMDEIASVSFARRKSKTSIDRFCNVFTQNNEYFYAPTSKTVGTPWFLVLWFVAKLESPGEQGTSRNGEEFETDRKLTAPKSVSQGIYDRLRWLSAMRKKSQNGSEIIRVGY